MGVIRINFGEGLDLVFRFRSRVISGVFVYVVGIEYFVIGYLYLFFDIFLFNCWMRFWVVKGM